MGCYEVSLGDTVGVGNPQTMNKLLKELNSCVDGKMDLLAIHCHDTYGEYYFNISFHYEIDSIFLKRYGIGKYIASFGAWY